MSGRTAVVTAPRAMRLEALAPPSPGPGELRVRLEGSGVCASSLPLWEGREWFAYPAPPGAPGHEGWGVIDALGDGVAGPRVGERVAALTYRAHATHDLARADAVVPLPPELDAMPFPGEPLGCAMNAFRRADVRAGDDVAVVGVGFLGALLTRLCAHAGARVIALSRRPFAREVARAFGAHHVLPLDEPSRAVEAVNALTGGKLCERVFECVGLQAPLDVAAALAAERGRLVIAGFHQDGPRTVDMFTWNWRGLDVVNAHERDPRTYVEGMRLAVHAVARGLLDPQPLLTHRFPLDELPAAYEAARRRPEGFVKALVMA